MAARSFKALLDHHEGVQVVGVASDSAAALANAERLSPDVVLVNLEFSDSDGLTTATANQA